MKSLLLLLFVLSYSSFSVTFDASQKTSTLSQPQLAGTCLPVFNPPLTYTRIKTGLALSHYATFRFPNGTLSNEYHWNGKGKYDSTGIWHPDTAVISGGFMSTNLYCGTTSSNYDTERYSKITDGDTTSFWWSDPSITSSDPYIFLSWTSSKAIDSVVILWGSRFSRNFEVQTWQGSVSYPGPHQMKDERWNTVFSDTAGAGGQTSVKFTSVSTLALRVISHKGFDGKDVQIREIFAYSNGTLITAHKPDQATQTKTFALSTHPGNSNESTWQWTFEKFMSYLDTMGTPSQAVICVNYGTGTAEEAAAWVYYANKVKKYNIKYWQVGNEMDGEWEIGGPVNAYTYSEKYLQFAKAMKAVDPSIKILGPLASGLDKLSGEHDNRTWLESTIFKIGETEKRDSCTYLDGIDFHCYPYWSSGTIKAQDMALASDYVYNRSDSMLAWINRYLYKPDSTLVMISEYNATVIMNILLKQPVNGIINANMNAGIAEKFGFRAMSLIWDSYEGGGNGKDGTHGSLSLFNSTAILAMTMPYAPSSAFWGNYMVTNIWLDPHKQNYKIKIDSSRSGYLRYYGASTGNDARVLVLNLSTTDTLNVNISMTGIPYSKVACYSWGDREFNMIGTTSTSYALPNCGPSSTITDSSKFVMPRIAPNSAMVLRYFVSDSGSIKPETFFRACQNSAPAPGDTIKVSYSSRAVNGFVQSISYKLDSAAYKNLTALDGAFDGPYENAVFSIDSRTLGEGKFNLIIRTIASNGDSCFDTVPLIGYSIAVNKINARKAENNLSLTTISNGKIKISYNPVQNGTAYIKIYNVSGALLYECSSAVTSQAPLTLLWNGTSSAHGSVSSGMYIVKAGLEGTNQQVGQIFKFVK
jgi:hypothetical protein